MFYKFNILIFLMFLSLILSCDGGPMDSQKPQINLIKNIPASAWKKLSQKKIYFGHQSVGFNIIDGINDLIKENPQINLNIVETNNAVDFTGGIFAHSRVGKNLDPISKIDEFSKFIQSGIGNRADIAMFKLCYVDIHPDSDLEKSFDEYKSKMAHLKNLFPKTTFAHVTVPLTSEPTGPKVLVKKSKDFIKKLIGKLNMYDNSNRNQFNKMLRLEYSGKEPIFDLAEEESTHLNGNRAMCNRNGKPYFFMTPEFTDDGGHLNKTGRKKVAEHFLLFLVNLDP